MDTVLPLASEYEIQSLIDRCEQFILQTYFSKQGTYDLGLLMKYVTFGVKYGTRNLQDKAAKALEDRHSTNIEKHPLYKELLAEDKVKLLNARVKYLEQCCFNAYLNCESSLRSLESWMKNNIDRYWSCTCCSNKETVNIKVGEYTKPFDMRNMNNSVENLEKSKDILGKCEPRVYARPPA